MKCDVRLPCLFFVWVVALPQLTKPERPENCVKGKQYWSKSVIDGGTCVKCPKHLTTCYDQPINDEARCLESCGKAKKFPASTSNPTTSISFKTPQVLKKFSTLSVLLTSGRTGIHRNEVNDDQKSKNVDGERNGDELKKILISVLVPVAVIAVIMSLLVRKIWKIRKSTSNRGQHRREDGREGPQPIELQSSSQEPSDVPAGPAVQVTPGVRVGGTQDTEEHSQYISVLNLPEDEC